MMVKYMKKASLAESRERLRKREMEGDREREGKWEGVRTTVEDGFPHIYNSCHTLRSPKQFHI